MSATKKTYAVGRGKPPMHSQFKKGESGNPGGKPGPRKSFDQRVREAVQKALDTEYSELSLSFNHPEDVLERMACKLVLRATEGNYRDRSAFFELMEKYGAAEQAAAPALPPPTESGGEPEGKSQDASLSQGKTQGSFENLHVAETIVQFVQAVGKCYAPASGNCRPPSPHSSLPTVPAGGDGARQGE